MSDSDPSDTDLIVSKSQRKREARAIFELARRLVALAPARLGRLPLDDDLRAQLMKTRDITAHVARKRETQFLAKLIRERECAETIEAALEQPAAESRQRIARAPVVARWADRLIDEGDAALTELLDACPGLDHQHLRQLMRNARRSAKHRTRLIEALATSNSARPLPTPDATV